MKQLFQHCVQPPPCSRTGSHSRSAVGSSASVRRSYTPSALHARASDAREQAAGALATLVVGSAANQAAVANELVAKLSLDRAAPAVGGAGCRQGPAALGVGAAV